jgi:broad specificity phosphatase PhoE
MIVSSDLRRATATAAPLSRLTGLPVTLDKDLRERFGGAWEGLTDTEINERYPREQHLQPGHRQRLRLRRRGEPDQ